MNVVCLQIPPLRERGSDILLLAEHFLSLSRENYGRKDLLLSEAGKMSLEAYKWPGNVREMRNIIERTVVMSETNEIGPEDLGLPLSDNFTSAKKTDSSSLDFPNAEFRFPLGVSLREIELEVIRRTLEFTDGDKLRAAEILGINQRTIYRKLPDL